MADSKYCDVLLNLRNTGVDAMKSYYANSFAPSHEKHRPDHIPHFKAIYDKYRDGIACLSSPEKTSAKYGCGFVYPPPHIKDARCNSSPYYVNGKVPFRHQDGKLNSDNVGSCCPPSRTPLLGDVPSSPHRSTHARSCDNKHSQHVNGSPYCKRSNMSPQRNIPERIHPDQRQHPDAQARFKLAAYRNENENYRTGHNPLYSQQALMEKHNTDNQHPRYENYRSVQMPCTLPCCYDVKPGDVRRRYERRETSPRMQSPPSMPVNVKNMDYPAHTQGLNTRDPSEASAFSPIRPSHVRRVHSTESGYSSESNGTCHSANSYKELELCNKTNCCGMSSHDSSTLHKMPHEFANENRQHTTNERRHNLPKEHQREHAINDHRELVGNNIAHQARFANGLRGHEHESLRLSMKEHQTYGNDRRLQNYILENNNVEKGCKERGEMRGDINLNDDFRERRISGTHYHDNVEDLWGERSDKHREQFNADNAHRVHMTDEKKQRIKSEGTHWNPGSDFDNCIDPRRLPPQSSGSKLDVCDEASRTAMKAFDAHIRKMIANSRDINSLNYLTKFHHSINQSNYSFTLPAGGRRSFSQLSDPGDTKSRVNHDKHSRRSFSTSSEPHDTKIQSTNDKHSMNQILSEKHSVSETNDTEPDKKIKEESPPPVQTEDKKNSFIELIIEKEEEPCEEKNSSNKSIDDGEVPTQPCDSTEITKDDHTDKDHISNSHSKSIEGDENEMLPLNDEDEEAPSPEVQCPAVDSTLNDDLAASPRGIGGLLGLTRVANEHLGQALAKEKKRSKNNNCLHLWQFLRRMLDQEQDKVGRCIEWTNRETGEFRLIKTAVIAELWGQSKNRTCMTYEKMARAMRYYYKMNILEKVPHKRLHFRFGERILSKVLLSSGSKVFIGKGKMYDELYNRLNERTINASYANSMLKPNDNTVNDFRNGHDLNYLNMHVERSKNAIPYIPTDLPGMTLPPYYSEHVNNHLRNNLPHISSNRINNIVPPLEFVPQKNEPDIFPSTIPGKIIPNSVNTSPGSNPSVSPYSGEETPETWSDIDSNDELIVDTDTE